MTPSAFTELLWRERATAILRAGEQRLAADAMEAAVRAGFRAIEFTLTTPGALELIADFARRPGLSVGAGTVLSADDAQRAVQAGASFLVAPNFDPEVVTEAARLGVASIPGVHRCSSSSRRRPAARSTCAPASGPCPSCASCPPTASTSTTPRNGWRPAPGRWASSTRSSSRRCSPAATSTPSRRAVASC